jgi:hypothetical protein
MSLREEVLGFLTKTYTTGDKIDVSRVVQSCGPTNTVVHILHTFAEEGVINQLIPLVCECDTIMYATERDVRSGVCKCVNCNRTVKAPQNLTEQQFAYFMK